MYVGYIIEDKKGNIWTSSVRDNSLARAGSVRDNSLGWAGSERDNSQAWALSRYGVKSLSDKKPTVTEIINKGAIFGILEDDKGNTWFGTGDVVYRYDGSTIASFNRKEGQK
jgi:hypothetical protein